MQAGWGEGSKWASKKKDLSRGPRVRAPGGAAELRASCCLEYLLDSFLPYH